MIGVAYAAHDHLIHQQGLRFQRDGGGLAVDVNLDVQRLKPQGLDMQSCDTPGNARPLNDTVCVAEAHHGVITSGQTRCHADDWRSTVGIDETQ